MEGGWGNKKIRIIYTPAKTLINLNGFRELGRDVFMILKIHFPVFVTLIGFF